MTARGLRDDKRSSTAVCAEQAVGWLPSALEIEVPLWLAMGVLSASAFAVAAGALITWL